MTAERTEMERLEQFLRENFRLDERIAAIENRKLYSLEIELTRRCNLECIYCYNSSSRDPGIPDFDFELLKRILREAYEYGIRSITYLGGEPTLYPQINEIIKFTKSIGMEEVVLYTNGTVMNDRLLDTINTFVNSVVIHIDSIDPDIFADVHRIDRSSSFGYFESILNNINLLKSSGYSSSKLRHCLTLFLPTYRMLEKTLQWAIRDENMLTSIFIPVVTIGRGSQIHKDDFLNLEEIKTAYEIRAEVEHRPELLLLGPSEYFKQYQMSTCYISVNAEVYPYAAMQTILGDLSVDKLSSVIDRSFQEISFSNVGFCENCFLSNYCFGTVAAVDNNIDNHPMCWHYHDRNTNEWTN
jgi:molybdenum cofactor biosynthesis enzyme MoaA